MSTPIPQPAHVNRMQQLMSSSPVPSISTELLTHSNGSVITFNAGGQIEIQANATVEVTASALNVHAATATFDGMVNCTTLNASVGVCSPSYTPGAGNIW